MCIVCVIRTYFVMKEFALLNVVNINFRERIETEIPITAVITYRTTLSGTQLTNLRLSVMLFCTLLLSGSTIKWLAKAWIFDVACVSSITGGLEFIRAFAVLKCLCIWSVLNVDGSEWYSTDKPLTIIYSFLCPLLSS